MMFKIAASILAATQLLGAVRANLFECVEDYDPDVDLFPIKYVKPLIASYGDTDRFGNKFEPHNTTDFLEITYFNTYKIVTNTHQDPPVSYLMYQCGTEPPEDVIAANDFQMVLPVPHKGGIALSQTPQIPYIEMLGLREEVIALIGNPTYVSSPCLKHMMDDGTIEIVYNSNDTVQQGLEDAFVERNPDVVIYAGPNQNILGGLDRVMAASATQERTNVAIFDWIAFYAALYNLEGESNKIVQDRQESYNCQSDVAKAVSAQRRELETDYKQKTILWARYFTYEDLGWSVAECQTWDQTYYCEYASHCDADILTRPEGTGYNKTFFGSPTVYWYMRDEEFLEMAKDADAWIYSGGDYDAIYDLKGDLMDQIKAVQDKEVYDTLGQGPSTWLEQRYAEYDVVGLDICDIVGNTLLDGPPHERRWIRHIDTEDPGSLDECNVPDEISQPYVAPMKECVRPSETSTGHSATVSSFVAFLFAMVAFTFAN